MRSALVLSFSDLRRDPRVVRQLRWLTASWRVTAAGWSDPQQPGVVFVPVRADYPTSLLAKLARGANLLARRFEATYWRITANAYDALQPAPHDLIIANDPETWPLAVRLATLWGAKVIMDAHEYAPSEFEENWKWRLLRRRYALHLCQRYLPQADAVLTIGAGIAEAYKELLGVTPTVITNAPEYHAELAPVPYDAGRPIRVVHHGAAIRTRQLETMVDVALRLDERFETSFLLVGDEGYQAWLRERADGHPRIHFRPPVPMEQLPRHLNTFDLGLFLLPPTSFNNKHALPNKLFEFIQARVGIAIGPSPEMARVVQACGNGVVADTFEPATLATLLNALTADDVNRFKQATHTHARIYAAETNQETFTRLCATLVERDVR